MRGTVTSFPDYSVYNTRELLDAFAGAPPRFRRAIGGLAEEDLHARPRGVDSWSIQEILLHVVDSELQGAFRVRKVLSEPGASLPGVDQRRWAVGLDYQAAGHAERERALSLFVLLRQGTSALLESATDADWAKQGEHAVYGMITLRNLLELYADHGERHLEQILACRRLLNQPLSIEPLLARRLY